MISILRIDSEILIRYLQNALLCHSEERSDEESLNTKITILQYLSGLRFTLRVLRFALLLKQDRSE